MIHATSSKIPAFFDLVVKKPVTDIATSMEAFCLSGIDGKPDTLNASIMQLLKHTSRRCRKAIQTAVAT